MPDERDLIVGFPLYEGCTLVDFAGATQVFGAPYGFKPIWIASKKGSITTTEGIRVLADYSFDDHPHIDILFVPGGGDKVAETMQNTNYLDFLSRTAETAIWRGSVCSGAFLLAAAGVLKNCTATTYWSQIPNLRLLADEMNLYIPTYFPRFLVDEESKVFTGGGISSSLDLALDLVLKIKGKEIAQKTQLYIQYQPLPPVNAGDPPHAPDYITKELRDADTDYTATMKAAVERLL